MGIEGHGVPHVEFSSTVMFMEVYVYVHVG